MKRSISLVLSFLLVLSLWGCQSRDAKAADTAILSIGTVTLQSEAAISSAEKAVNALSQKERESLQNLQILTQARADYDTLLSKEEAKKIDDQIAAIGEVTLKSEKAVQKAETAWGSAPQNVKDYVEKQEDLCAAREAYDRLVLADQAKQIDGQITAIGEVTLKSEKAIAEAEKAYENAPREVRDLVTGYSALEKARSSLNTLLAEDLEARISGLRSVTLDTESQIQSARKAYENAPQEVKDLVENLEILEKAEESLQNLKEKEKLQKDKKAAAQVDSLIRSIGTVNVNSQEKIEKAQKAYDRLTPAQKALVQGSKKLQGAPAALRKAKEQKLRSNLSQMRKDPDPFQGVTFYFPRAFPWGQHSWLYDSRDFVLPYFVVYDDFIEIHTIINCIASEFIYMKQITMIKDGIKSTLTFDSSDVDRNYSWGDFCESYDGTVDTGVWNIINTIGDSKEVLVRFEGPQYYVDMKMSQSDIQTYRLFKETCLLAQDLGYHFGISK